MTEFNAWCPSCATPLPPFSNNDAWSDTYCPGCGKRVLWVNDHWWMQPPAKMGETSHLHPFRCPNCQLSHRKDSVAIFGPSIDQFCDRCGYNLTKDDGSFKGGKPKSYSQTSTSQPTKQQPVKQDPKRKSSRSQQQSKSQISNIDPFSISHLSNLPIIPNHSN